MLYLTARRVMPESQLEANVKDVGRDGIRPEILSGDATFRNSSNPTSTARVKFPTRRCSRVCLGHGRQAWRWSEFAAEVSRPATFLARRNANRER